jgi:hypothetical protein
MDNEITRLEPVTPAAQGRRPRKRLMVAILGAAVVIAASIGVSAAMAADPTGTAAGGPIPVDPAFTQFAACMKDHGVDMGTPMVSLDATVDGVTGSGGAVAITGFSDTVSVGGPVPAGGAVPTPLDDAAFKAANDACAPILEAAGIKSGVGTIVSGSALQVGPVQVGSAQGGGAIGIATAGGDVTKMSDDLTAYAACMRTNGVEMPDPVMDTKAGTVSLQMTGDPGSAAFQAASTACASTSPLVPLSVPGQP